MKVGIYNKGLVLASLSLLVSCSDDVKQDTPNILLIVADDLGLGDVSAYGRGALQTPNIDRLAEEGILFERGYSTASISTPSRYSLMTGLYSWKNPDANVLPGDAPLLIPTDIPTLPKMMQEQGYTTAAIGKWHLGMGNGDIDWNGKISPSVNDVGFDYSCVIAATNDRVPTVYIENGEVVGLKDGDAPIDSIFVSYSKNFEGEPTALTNPELLKMKWHHGHNNSVVNGIPRIGFMKGGENARWVDEDMADYFVGKVKNFIDDNSEEPFFLYYGLHQPHVPRAPHPRFVGATDFGPRGDVIAEADWCVGEIINYLDEKNILENTLVIFTSDNGPVLNDGYYDNAVEMIGNHDPYGGLRGGKYSLYDGGTHIPFIVYWKGELHPMVSDAYMSQIDLFASLAEFVGADMPEDTDSENHLDVLLGKSQNGRQEMIMEAHQRLVYRNGDYVLIPPYDGEVRNITNNELANLPDYALFNIREDRSQLHDISKENLKKLQEMKNRFFELSKGYFQEK